MCIIWSAKVKMQLWGVDLFLPQLTSQGLNSGHQVWRQMPLQAEHVFMRERVGQSSGAWQRDLGCGELKEAGGGNARTHVIRN